jgi:hypothetical protein
MPSEIEDLSARLLALETVVRQLVTHIAVRTDDPPQWVATRKVLALHALADDDAPGDGDGDGDYRDTLRGAITDFFHSVEYAVDGYAPETPRPALR